jgi:cold shock CspA family protein
MARSQQYFNKREKEKQRAKQKQDKQEKMEERKASGKKTKSLDDMMAYLDENGNLSATPPDPSKRKTFNQDDIEIGVPKQRAPEPGELIRKGMVSFFNETKRFGFIKDSETGESVFFHESDLSEPLKEGNRVSFEVEMGNKGPVATNIQKQNI